MNGNPATIVRELRALMPARAVEEHEARSVAERQATKLIKLFNISQPAVDVGLLADLPRMQIVGKSTHQLGGLSGASEWSKGRWLIAVNSDDSITRRRFTLGHEFKHVLDHPFIGVLYPDSSGQPSQERAERICDYFGACLLMPRVWVKRAWGNGIHDQAALAALFDVSEAAMSVRLQQIGLVEPRQRYRFTAQPVRRYFRTAPVSAPAFPIAA